MCTCACLCGSISELGGGEVVAGKRTVRRPQETHVPVAASARHYKTILSETVNLRNSNLCRTRRRVRSRRYETLARPSAPPSAYQSFHFIFYFQRDARVNFVISFGTKSLSLRARSFPTAVEKTNDTSEIDKRKSLVRANQFS